MHSNSFEKQIDMVSPIYKSFVPKILLYVFVALGSNFLEEQRREVGGSIRPTQTGL